jgi:hypothetical protein
LGFRVDRRGRHLRAAVVVHRDARVFLTMRPMTWLTVRLNHDAQRTARERERARAMPVHALASHSVKRADDGVRAGASRLAPAAMPALAGSQLYRVARREPVMRTGGATTATALPRADSTSNVWRVRIRQGDPGSARAGTIRTPDAPGRAITAPRQYRAALAAVSRRGEPSTSTVRGRDAVAAASVAASAPLSRPMPQRVTRPTTLHDTRMQWASPSARTVRASVAPASELVWANASRTARAVEATRLVTPDARPAPAPSAHDPAWQAEIVARACEVVRREMLGSAVVERLAEDVMRRIDRRSRIERERRGL